MIIPDNAFKGLSGLESVSMCDHVHEIGAYVFNGCSGLRNVSIPETIQKIGSGAFQTVHN